MVTTDMQTRHAVPNHIRRESETAGTGGGIQPVKRS